MNCPSPRILFWFSAALALVVIGGTFYWNLRQRDAPFSLRTCKENVPDNVEGLRILRGERTKTNVIHDMVPVACSAQALYQKTTSASGGVVTFRVSVEYTGEVIDVAIKETTIQSERFLKSISGYIKNTDFTPWERHDEDTVFLYPMNF